MTVKTAKVRTTLADDGALLITAPSRAKFRVEYTVDGKPRMIVPLTLCCGASGKGMEYETGTGCRHCYREVDSIYGGFGEWGERTKIGVWFLGDTPQDLVRYALQAARCADVAGEAALIFAVVAAESERRAV